MSVSSSSSQGSFAQNLRRARGDLSASMYLYWVIALFAFPRHPFPVSLPLTMTQSQDLILFPLPGILVTPSRPEPHHETSHVLAYSIVKAS